MNLRRALAALAAVISIAAPVRANEIAKADLRILGLGLEVDTRPVVTDIDVPARVQTIFGGATNDQAPPAPDLSAVGELTGPGIETPITLIARPGHAFVLPALHEKGDYALQNIRLVNSKGEFLQQAIPSFASITVKQILETSIKVRQLSPDELRQRGISLDDRNYDVYEYTFVFAVDGKNVEIPYPVIVDNRTHEFKPAPALTPYSLPGYTMQKPPRFRPPHIFTFSLDEDLGGDEPARTGNDSDKPVAPPFGTAIAAGMRGGGAAGFSGAGTVAGPARPSFSCCFSDEPLLQTA